MKRMLLFGVIFALTMVSYAQAFSTGGVVNHTNTSRIVALWENGMLDYAQRNGSHIGALYVCIPKEDGGKMKYAYSYGHQSPDAAKRDAASYFDIVAGTCTQGGHNAIRFEVKECNGRTFFTRY